MLSYRRHPLCYWQTQGVNKRTRDGKLQGANAGVRVGKAEAGRLSRIDALEFIATLNQAPMPRVNRPGVVPATMIGFVLPLIVVTLLVSING